MLMHPASSPAIPVPPGLHYVNSNEEGIERRLKGKNFSYWKAGKRIQDKPTIDRIKKLAIPPVWKQVWICTDPDGHLQATGRDARDRKQYIYHKEWIKIRSRKKFAHMLEWGQRLPQIRKHINHDLSLPGFPRQKILALVLRLMEYTHIRVGNDAYEKMYGSFGLTTLKNKHVSIKGDTVKFYFKGKKGIQHEIYLHHSRLARLLRKCKEIPSRELFRYKEASGDCFRIVDSGMVNTYIQSLSGTAFSAKDFRTWSGSVLALEAFYRLGHAEKGEELQQNIRKAINETAAKLGNTPAVCRRYYVHPRVVALYESGRLMDYFKKITVGNTYLSRSEKIFLKILQK